MIIQNYKLAKGERITPCPNGMKQLGEMIMVGSLICHGCMYFIKEALKTVECRYELEDRDEY